MAGQWQPHVALVVGQWTHSPQQQWSWQLTVQGQQQQVGGGQCQQPHHLPFPPPAPLTPASPAEQARSPPHPRHHSSQSTALCRGQPLPLWLQPQSPLLLLLLSPASRLQCSHGRPSCRPGTWQ
jgi:hypothetical protein